MTNPMDLGKSRHPSHSKEILNPGVGLIIRGKKNNPSLFGLLET